MNMIVDNGDTNGYYCYMNSSTRSIMMNQNYIYYTYKRDEIYTIKYLRGNNGLSEVLDIYDMLPVSALNQYANMEYNN